MNYDDIGSSFRKLIKKIETVNGLYISITAYYDSHHPLFDHYKDTNLDKKEEDFLMIRNIIDNDGFWNSFNQDLHDVVKKDKTGIIDKHLIKLLMEIERCLRIEHGYFDLMAAIDDGGNDDVMKRYDGLKPFFNAVSGLYSRYEHIRDDIFSYMDFSKFDRVTLFEDKYMVGDKFLELKKEFQNDSIKLDPYPGSSVPVKALITYVLIEIKQIDDFPDPGVNRRKAIEEYGHKNFGVSGKNFANCFYMVQNGTYPTLSHIEQAENFLASNNPAFNFLQSLRPNSRAGK